MELDAICNFQDAHCFSPLKPSEIPDHLDSIAKDCGIKFWLDPFHSALWCSKVVFSHEDCVSELQSLKDLSKRIALKRFLEKIHLDIVLIQESKKEEFDIVFIKSLWSSKDNGWELFEPFGHSGGILTLWDMSKLKVIETLKGGYSLSINHITVCKKSCWITNVYGPNDHKERRLVWPELLSLSNYCTKAWCISGDSNIRRWAHERFPFKRNT